ncbi:hypothetical protein Cob_v004171 [Colletotrichum orbiculare MAFF 240422]|uniref:Uncharacterized protein n=1 Tax=Colletotrichum orbiculare (strain 104-T / ATCC 96160 / CBS 514.97 / LARS 414 / MAFF 240422) TaxID=1213857 RepID=A0A484FXK2_COLOR|nr:hypothetical protein Cob_v004171 [Colletotrichum orbiculare MAFF 240422]
MRLKPLTRGDNHQSPAFCSCGNGAGVASYDWVYLDTASVTGGSIRLPVKANGLFSLQVTNASLPSPASFRSRSSPTSPASFHARTRFCGLPTATGSKVGSTVVTSHAATPRQSFGQPNRKWDGTSMPLFESFTAQLSAHLIVSLKTGVLVGELKTGRKEYVLGVQRVEKYPPRNRIYKHGQIVSNALLARGCGFQKCGDR